MTSRNLCYFLHTLFSETLVTLHLLALKSFEGPLKLFLVFCKLMHFILFWNLCFFISLFMDVPIQVQWQFISHLDAFYFQDQWVVSHTGCWQIFLWGWGPSPELNAFRFTRISKRHKQPSALYQQIWAAEIPTRPACTVGSGRVR